MAGSHPTLTNGPEPGRVTVNFPGWRIRSAPAILRKYYGSSEAFGLRAFPAVWIQAKKRIAVGQEIRANYGPDAVHMNAVPHSTQPPLHSV